MTWMSGRGLHLSALHYNSNKEINISEYFGSISWYYGIADTFITEI
jgi:hypothetical protein